MSRPTMGHEPDKATCKREMRRRTRRAESEAVQSGLGDSQVEAPMPDPSVSELFPLPASQKPSLQLHDTRFAAWYEHPDDRVTLAIRDVIIGALREMGFHVQVDPRTLKDHPSLYGFHWYARRGDLEAIIDAMGRTASVEFYQNVVNVDNPNGGRYCFDKAQRMPPFMRRQTAIVLRRLIETLSSLGFALPDDLPRLGPLQLRVLRAIEGRSREGATPLECFNRTWTSSRFRRDARGYPLPEEYKDGSVGGWLQCGMVRYTRYKGRLARGVIFTNMGNRWAIHLPSGPHYVNAEEIFDCERPDLLPRRFVPGQIDRLTQMLVKEIKAQHWPRVVVLSKVIDRIAKTTVAINDR